MIEQSVITRYEEQTLQITVKTSEPMTLRLIVKDSDKDNTVFTDRLCPIEDELHTFYVRMPLCGNKSDILLFNPDNEDDNTGFEITKVVRAPLQKRLDLIDFKNTQLKSFIRFSQRFSFNAGWMRTNDPENPNDYYVSDDNQFFIKYLPVITDENGNIESTPSRIETGSGLIDVSQEHFLGATVPMREAILLHEFAHIFLNENPADETEADLNSLLVYLALGYPRIEAHEAWIGTFEDAPSEENLDRYEIIEQFIKDFENNNLVIHGY